MLAVWAEMDAVLADEFRDGNVPAQMAPLTVAKAAFAALPKTVSSYYYRGDSKAYRASRNPRAFRPGRMSKSPHSL